MANESPIKIFAVKMATVIFVETLENIQPSVRLILEIRRYSQDEMHSSAR